MGALSQTQARLALRVYASMLDGFKFGDSEDEIVRKKKGIRHIIRIAGPEVYKRDIYAIWFIADADLTKGFLAYPEVPEAIKRFNASEMGEKNFCAFAELDKTKKFIRVHTAYVFYTDAYLTLDNYAEANEMLINLSVMNQVFCEELHRSLDNT